MAVSKVTGDPVLDSMLAALGKKFNKEEQYKTIGCTAETVESFSTGSFALDIGLGTGGWPVGRVIEIFGPEASGKTSLAIKSIGEWQKAKVRLKQEDRYAMFMDIEHATYAEIFSSLGVDEKNLIWKRTDSAEESMQVLMDLVKTGKIGVAVIDSVDAMQSERVLGKDVGENDVGGISKLMNRTLRELSKVASNTNTTIIFINQIKQNPNASYGANPNVTPGGGALKYYSSVRLELMKKAELENKPRSFLMRVKIVKNKCAAPRKDPVHIEFEAMKGPDLYDSVFTAAKELGVIRSAGQSVKINLTGTEEVLSSTGGKNSAILKLRSDPELLTSLQGACLARAKQTVVAQPEEEDEPSDM